MQLLNLTSYLPDVTDIPQNMYQDTYDRLMTYFRTNLPDIDISPDSVVGDVVIRPLVIALTVQEYALSVMVDDIDPNKIESGDIANEEFVSRFLNILGAGNKSGAKSFGTVKLIFSEDKEYILSRNTLFKLSGTNTLQPYVYRDSDIHIKPSYYYYSEASKNNTYKLSKGDDNKLSVLIPVYGDLNSNIASGTSLTYDIEGVISASIDSDIKASNNDMTLKDSLDYVRKTLYAASFTNRYSIISYFKNRFPNIRDVYPVMSTDKEMKRGIVDSVIGAKNGCVDIYVRPNLERQKKKIIVPFSGFNMRGPIDNGYVWNFTGIIPRNINVLSVLSVRDINTGDIIPESNITAISRTYDSYGLGYAFSEKEEISILIKDYGVYSPPTYELPVSTTSTFNGKKFSIDSGRINNFFQDSSKLTENGFSLFNTNSDKSVAVNVIGTIQINNKNYVKSVVKDNLTGAEIENVIFDIRAGRLVINYMRSPDDVFSVFAGAEVELFASNDDGTYHEITFKNISDVVNAGPITVTYKLERKEFEVEYETDSDLLFLNNFIKTSDDRPVYDAIIRYPNICKLENITINYIKRPWDTVDEVSIKEKVREYIMTRFYPDMFNIGELSSLLKENGVYKLDSLSVNGNVYVSPANFHMKGDREVDGVIGCGPFSVNSMEFDIDGLSNGYRATNVNTVYSVTTDEIKILDVTK